MFRDKLIEITKQFLDGDMTKLDACSEVENAMSSILSRAGVTGLTNLTDAGMIASLFFLYGAGLLPAETINDFAQHPEKKDVLFYSLSLKPSEEENSLFFVNIQFAKAQDKTRELD